MFWQVSILTLFLYFDRFTFADFELDALDSSFEDEDNDLESQPEDEEPTAKRARHE